MAVDHVHEGVEKLRHIMRPRRRFRMPLEAEGGRVIQGKTLVGSVEERAVRHRDAHWQMRFVDGETLSLIHI